MLSFELRNKGIDPKIIDQVLEESTPDEDLAYLAAQKQIRRYRHLDWKDFRRKLGSFLARRGFSYATINPIVNQIWAELDSESEIGIYKIEDL
jgi:regulatory protein